MFVQTSIQQSIYENTKKIDENTRNIDKKTRNIIVRRFSQAD